MSLTIEDLRKFGVYKFDPAEIAENIPLVPYSAYVDAVDDLYKEYGIDHYDGAGAWWEDVNIEADYSFDDDHDYHAELDDVIDEARTALDNIFSYEGDTLGVIDERGVYIPLPLFFSYKENEYMSLNEAIDEAYDELPDEITGYYGYTEAYFDSSYGNYLPREYDYESSSSCDWDIDIDKAYEYLEDEVKKETDKILSIPEEARLKMAQHLNKTAKDELRDGTEHYLRYQEYIKNQKAGVIKMTMGGQPIEQLIRSIFVDVPLEETDDYSVYAKNIEKAVIKKENTDGTLEKDEDWDDPEKVEELFYKTIKPCDDPEVRIYAMNGIKPRILAGIELGENDTRRFDEKGERIINELCSRIPDDELVEKSAEAVRKDNELYGTEGIFCDVTEDDVRQGHFNLSGIITGDERIRPYVSILVHDGEPELSFGIVDEELEYTIPLTDNEKKAVMRCIGEKVNLDAFKECLQNYKETEVENDPDIERE